MRVRIKTSILSGLLRTFVSIIYLALAKINQSLRGISSGKNNEANSSSSIYSQDEKKKRDGGMSSSSWSSSCSDVEENNSHGSTSTSIIYNRSHHLIHNDALTHLNCKKSTSSSTASSWSTTTTSLSESSDEDFYELQKSKNQPTVHAEAFYEYKNELGALMRIFTVNRKLKKQESTHASTNHSNSPFAKAFRFKTALAFALLIFGYICLNNYLIMFFYYKSYNTMQQQQQQQHQSSSSSHSTCCLYNNNQPQQSAFKSAGLYLLNTWPFVYILAALPSNLADEAEQAEKARQVTAVNHSMASFAFDAKIKLFIDPQDIEIDGLDFSDLYQMYAKKPEQFVFLEDSFFDDSNNSRTTSNRTKPNRPCVHPILNPYDSEIMQFVKKETDLRCNPKRNWIYVKNGTIRVAKSAIKNHGTIVCAYIPLYRGNSDFSIYEGNRIFPVMDKMPLITDFFKIDCRSKDGAIYSNIHSGIAYESSLHMRHLWNPLPLKALGYNVLMFGFDSVSRMSWIRMLPRSYEYMIKQGFVVLKGYNIVGDGTPQALLPILTGKKETELPEARRGFSNASYVDSFPWIWKAFRNAGYVTQWAEDMQSIGTFQLRMMGFRKQPVDHYMRVFYLEAERYYSRFRRLCLGSISRHNNMLNWVREFFQMYTDKPKFSFIFHSEASHNYNNPLGLLDEDVLAFLKYLKTSAIMENTILMFMSDHGVRVSDLRQFSQGKLEERMPFFSVRMPDSFQQKYPNEMRNLRMNSRKLTTPFDIHETFKDFLHFNPSKVSPPPSRNQHLPRGLSLLGHIPASRSCHDAHIEAHWCSCLNWINLNITTSENRTVERINSNDHAAEKEDHEGEEEEAAEEAKNTNQSSSVSTKRLGRAAIDYRQYAAIRDQLRVYKDSTLKAARKAVKFINSLIDKDLRKECEWARLHSVQKLAKLELNRKLLTFKESKDIHGREALFEEDLAINETDTNNATGHNSTSSSSISALLLEDDDQFLLSPLNTRFNLSNEMLRIGRNGINQPVMSFKRSMNAETVFQIALTTWPGNATYELSFRYNRYDGEFKFNKNEISRINNYNSTSSCMLSKRPDLRQYCYCKYS